MSGGVDSSLAASLLLEQGLKVTGITLEFLPPGPRKGQEAEDARLAAESLGIEHQVWDIAAAFQRLVMEPFEVAYRQGRTPNPCVECNKVIKFGLVLERAQAAGFTSMATGHYARITASQHTFHLLRGIDPVKDQSYFLYRIGRESLPHVRFPLGGLTKEEVRRRAEAVGLHSAGKEESQDICFLQGQDYRHCLSAEDRSAGRIVDSRGRTLGEHAGIENFTIGQRKGIGLHGGPYYVIDLCPESAEVVVGSREEAMKPGLKAGRVVWLEPVEPGQKIEAKIRSRNAAVPAEIVKSGPDSFDLRFDQKQFAITPGQSAVLYREDKVLGGGIIEQALDDFS
jgi:tRNA-specific 2-thiouridylase